MSTGVRDAYAQSTRAALLAAGREEFSTHAYADVSAEQLVEAAGLSRGALYHHFDGKRGLFEAIFTELEVETALRVRDAIEEGTDPFDRVERGADAFLDACTGSVYRHVVLVQGPSVLGWRRWRDLDRHHLGTLVNTVMSDLLDDGLIKAHRADLVASAFYGLLTEMSIDVAEADDPEHVRTEAQAVTRDLLRGLRVAS